LKNIRFDYDLIAISDYNKGFLTEEDIAYICKNHPNVFIDSKKKISTWANDAKYIKINNFEYLRSKPTLTSELEKKVIHTKGGDGCIFQDKIFPVAQTEVKDSSGAGDTFFAALIVSYARTGDIEEAIQFANTCASKVVKERGVTTL
jgi:sugar/nucleoside kinase (ribokinase family)